MKINTVFLMSTLILVDDDHDLNRLTTSTVCASYLHIFAAMEDDNVEDATLLTVLMMISPLVGSACQANVP